MKIHPAFPALAVLAALMFSLPSPAAAMDDPGFAIRRMVVAADVVAREPVAAGELRVAEGGDEPGRDLPPRPGEGIQHRVDPLPPARPQADQGGGQRLPFLSLLELGQQELPGLLPAHREPVDVRPERRLDDDF